MGADGGVRRMEARLFSTVQSHGVNSKATCGWPQRGWQQKLPNLSVLYMHARSAKNLSNYRSYTLSTLHAHAPLSRLESVKAQIGAPIK